jgi:hypothetical protein
VHNAVSRNSNVDCGLFCPKAKGFSARGPAGVRPRSRGLPHMRGLSHAGRAWWAMLVNSLSFLLEIRNSSIFYFLSRTLIININSHRCPKIMK